MAISKKNTSLPDPENKKIPAIKSSKRNILWGRRTTRNTHYRRGSDGSGKSTQLLIAKISSNQMDFSVFIVSGILP